MKKNWFSRVFAIAFVAGICFPVFSQSSNSSVPKTKIRVGFFEFQGYHHIAPDGTKSGYGYDFLQMIAPYAGFEYEYVGYDKSWSEIQKMLENGEIDLLTSAQKTPSREKIFDFSDRSIGYSSTILTTRPSNTHFITSDFKSLGVITVGMIENNSRNDSFERYARTHGIIYETAYFKDQNMMATAMKYGNIDAMVTSDLRLLDNEIVVAKFDDSPFYVVAKDGNKELIQKVNYAIEMLSSDSPNWIHALSYKYYSNTHNGNEIILTKEEKTYLKSMDKLTVLFNPDRAPYSSFEGGKPKGIFVDLFEKIASDIGLEYEIVKCKTVKEYETCIREEKADIVFGSVMDYFTAEDMAYSITNSFHTTSLACVTRVNETNVIKRVAVNEGMSILNRTYDKLYGDREQIKYETIAECIEAVRTRKADCCYAYIYTAAKYVYEDAKGVLAYSPINESTANIAIAVRNTDGPVLFHLMNRIAGNLTENEIQTAVANNTNFNYDGNIFLYLIYKRPVFTILTVIFILLFGFTMMMFKRNRDRKMAMLLLKESQAKRDALELACEAAEKANKAKSDFLSKMSHDIRTPMNAIVGMTAIAQCHINDPEKVSENLAKINSSSHHLLALINDVLDMSKIESGTFSLSYEDFNIVELLNDLAEIMGPDMRSHKHNFKVNFENLRHENVVGDSLRIQQVFVNITGNAVKYTPDGGEIEILVRELESTQPNIGTYEFLFKDNGIGMSKEFMNTIFEPFSREKDSRVDKIQGTGLGLAITKNIITMMGGTIEVESEQNKGSTFKIGLMLKLKENSDGEKTEPTSESLEKHETAEEIEEKRISPLKDFSALNFIGKKVLLAEDNDINSEIAREILEMAGLEVDVAENGKIAFEKFATSEIGEYSIIFMDIQMPEMNGYDASSAIRSLSRDDALSIPIVAMTANAFKEDVEKAMRSGMNDHISKPLDMKKLAAVLKEFLEK